MSFNIGLKRTRLVFCACLSLMLGAAASLAAEKKDSGPTQAQIDCKNRAVNDYYDQMKECDKALSDIPQQNAQCKSDAYDDMRRTQAGCTAAATVGPRFQGITGGRGGMQLKQ